MTESPLLRRVEETMKAAGIEGALLQGEAVDPEHFGDGEVVLRLGALMLRFIRDRGEDFLDVGSAAAPDRFHQFDDVEIAMGWRSLDQVLAKKEPAPLTNVLLRLRERLSELQSAMSSDQEPFTKARIERAAAERGAAFVAGLR